MNKFQIWGFIMEKKAFIGIVKKMMGIEKISMSAKTVMSALPSGLSSIRKAGILQANPGNQLSRYRKTAKGLIEQAQRLKGNRPRPVL